MNDFFSSETHFRNCFFQNRTLPAKSKEKKDKIADSLSEMANSFSSYFQTKSVPMQQPIESPAKPPMKYTEMWANFDKLVSKLDEDAVDELNIEITNLIGAALKKKRESS